MLLHDDHVLGALHHADRRGVAARIAADRALLVGGDVETALAEARQLAQVDDGLGETPGVGFVHVEKVEGEALRGLRSHPGKTRQLIYDSLYGPSSISRAGHRGRDRR